MKNWIKANPVPFVLIAIITLLVIYALGRWLLKKYLKLNPQTMTTSREGREFIKTHEALRTTAYDDKRPNSTLKLGDVVLGTLTIGYGHTGPDVYIGQTITAKQADDLLAADLKKFENVVKKYAKVNLTQNQFDALVSFAYNTGGSSETVWRMVNTGASEEEFKAWFTTNYITSKGQRMGGLVKRRKDEANLYWS